MRTGLHHSESVFAHAGRVPTRPAVSHNASSAMRTFRVHVLLAGAAISLSTGAAAQLSTPLDSTTLSAFRWRTIGPAVMGGRITDIEADPRNPKIFYVVAATGGIWKTDQQRNDVLPDLRQGIGDLDGRSRYRTVESATSSMPAPARKTRATPCRRAVAFTSRPMPAKRGSSAVSTATQQIGRIVVDPQDPNIVYVAALGHAWEPNPERGLYKTTDGGTTWKLSKFISDKAGFVDLAMDPTDHNTLFASSWERVRGPYFLKSGGPGSGLWKTTDAGATWTEVKGGGFPATTKGRIGIAIAPSNPKMIYALVEADTLQKRSAKGNVARHIEGAADEQRPLSLDRWRCDVDADAAQRRRCATVLLLAGSRRSEKSESRVLDVVRLPLLRRWRKDRTTRRSVASHRLARDVDRSQRSRSLHTRRRRRNRRHVGQGRHVRFHQHLSDRTVLRRQLRHAEAVQRLRRTSGQWIVVRSDANARTLRRQRTPTGKTSAAATDSIPRRIRTIRTSSTANHRAATLRVSTFRPTRAFPSCAAVADAPEAIFEDSLIIARGDTTQPVNAADLDRARCNSRPRSRRFRDALSLQLGGAVFPFAAFADDGVHGRQSPAQVDRSRRPFLSDLSRSFDEGFDAGSTSARERPAASRAMRPAPRRTERSRRSRSHRSVPAFSGPEPTTAMSGSRRTTAARGPISRSDFRGSAKNVGEPTSSRRTSIPQPSMSSFDDHRDNNFKPYLFVSNDFGRTFRSIVNNLPADGVDFVHVVREDPYNQRSSFRWHRCRRVCLDQSRCDMAALHDGIADSSGSRSQNSSARPRDHRGHARPFDLDRRHCAARADG